MTKRYHCPPSPSPSPDICIACVFFGACLLIIIHTDVLHSRVLIYVSRIKRHGFTGQLPHSCIPTGTHGERWDGVGRDLRCKLIQGPLNTGKHTPPSPLVFPVFSAPSNQDRERERGWPGNQSKVRLGGRFPLPSPLSRPMACLRLKEHRHHWHLVAPFGIYLSACRVLLGMFLRWQLTHAKDWFTICFPLNQHSP